MRVLCFDLESTSLEASWGRVLLASFVELGSDNVKTLRGDRRPYKSKDPIDDSKLVMAIRDELEAADIVVSWNGILFDVPLLNARLALRSERPCRLSQKHGVLHLDAMYYVGGTSMRIGGRKLDTAAKFFGLENQKTGLNGETWQRASAGDKKAMNDIQEHCEQDVLALRDAWPYVAPMVAKMTFHLSEVWPFIQQIPSRRNTVKA